MNDLFSVVKFYCLHPRKLKSQLSNAYHNYREYGHFSLNKNSPEYFDSAYKNLESYDPEHYPKMLKYLPTDGDLIICDFGCGTGEGTALLKQKYPRAEVHGIDYSKVAIEKAQNKAPRVEFFQIDITETALRAHYDFIVTVETLEHFRNPFKIIDKLLRFIKPKGYLFISVPYTEDEKMEGPVFTFGKHLYNYNEKSLSRYKAQVLDIIDIQRYREKCIFYKIVKDGL